MSPPASTPPRRSRIRWTVSGWAVALFLAAFMAVAGWGHRPLTSPTQGAAAAPRVTVVGDDGQVVSTSTQGSAPLTSRTSGGSVVTSTSPSASPGAPATTVVHLRDS